MAFELQPADKAAIAQVSITGDPSGFTLDSKNIQFPPKLTKDGKSSNWTEKSIASYEPFKVYAGASPRVISLEFQWVAGGNFGPNVIMEAINNVKGYFYTGYKGSGFKKYPAVIINKFYGYIDERTSWRMLSLDISFSEELVRVNNNWLHLHTKMTMNLESATQLGNPDGGGKGLLKSDNLEKAPKKTWY